MGWRLFVAVDLGASVRRALDRIQRKLQPLARDARWVDPQNAHLTLAFLGSMEEALVPRRRSPPPGHQPGQDRPSAQS